MSSKKKFRKARSYVIGKWTIKLRNINQRGTILLLIFAWQTSMASNITKKFILSAAAAVFTSRFAIAMLELLAAMLRGQFWGGSQTNGVRGDLGQVDIFCR